MLLIVGGAGTVSINWSTGAFWFNILQCQILAATAMASSEYSPWIIKAGFFLGAIVFCFTRKSFIERSKGNSLVGRDADNIGTSI